MKSLDRLTRLKERVDEAMQDKAKATGALEQIQEQLRKDYGCATIEEAEKLLTKLNRKAEQAEGEFTAALDKFEEDFKED